MTAQLQKINAKYPIDREKISLLYVAKYSFTIIAEVISSILNALNSALSDEKDTPIIPELTQYFKIDLHPSTLKKRDSLIVNTQILVNADNNNNAVSVCESFKSISEDNELIYKKQNQNIT